MAKTIDVEVPRRSLCSDLTGALAARGLHAEILEDDVTCRLVVSFAESERERLVADATHAIEAYLAERALPLVVQGANGRCVVRPPAD